MSRFTSLYFVIAAMSAAPAFSIIMRDGVAEAKYRNLGERYRPYVAQLALTDSKGVPSLYDGNGTLIGPHWVLTARHAARLIKTSGERPHVIFVNGEGYPVEAVFLSEGELKPQKGPHGTNYGTNDAALLKLARPVKAERYPCLYEGGAERGMPIVVVGTGLRGTGRTGVGEPDGALRGATQTIEQVQGDMQVVSFDFDRPGSRRALPLEGISGPGDSGGPAFATGNGRLCVVGISSGQDEKGGPEGRYGVTEYYTRVSSFVPWIRRVIEANGGF